jgi:hypothetical protein
LRVDDLLRDEMRLLSAAPGRGHEPPERVVGAALVVDGEDSGGLADYAVTVPAARVRAPRTGCGGVRFGALVVCHDESLGGAIKRSAPVVWGAPAHFTAALLQRH